MEKSSSNAGLNIYETKTGILVIQIDNPKKKNALKADFLKTIKKRMEEAISIDSIKCIMFCNKKNSQFFTSGNDFNSFSILSYDEMANLFEDFINFLINYPKILVAAINGVCVGMGVTMLCHFDIVIASERANFVVPFIQTLQVPEGTSSYMFPKLFGKLAGHMLYSGQGINVDEAKNGGLVTVIINNESEDENKDDFIDNSIEYVNNIAKNSNDILIKFKSMVVRYNKEFLMEVNKYECKQLRASWDNEEFKKVMNKFVKPKPKF